MLKAVITQEAMDFAKAAGVKTMLLKPIKLQLTL
jgi:hypothetical protein